MKIAPKYTIFETIVDGSSRSAISGEAKRILSFSNRLLLLQHDALKKHI